MPRIIVIGSVNHDRIWQLDAPLVPGARIQFSSQTTRLGGGAYYTGRQLLELGADVALVSRLMLDAQGQAALQSLVAAGFDTKHIAMAPGETAPLEILLEPNGERTIIAPAGRSQPLKTAAQLSGAGVYINALALDAGLVEQIDAQPLVVSQFPLRPATPRPADYVISSRDDVPDDLTLAWQRAGQIAGSRLKMLILTDGTRPITLFDGLKSVEIEPAAKVDTANTIGAGDRFAGSFLFALVEGRTPAAAAREASRITAEWLRRRGD
ncbi:MULTISPECIES: PfkB family carbohydrate kinase [unclassified Rhizobium]|jgi:sugar/nucleoside kinase (ribokinase family)|uniref:PfkB family carbohydrate kinase n=1 Tax=unclassified Rhizobium TaxID=2613769 RepID=UPI0006462D27|nr:MULTISPECIES: PfkB family carbohydrate kinase [unclassified Rhizobium]MBN8950607.1 carbohydrate kinase [Rhizobium tropici]OJY66155.1 MAG: carbohydrate kinase [Rhizobium sp. 60-20]RKD69295.1 sugar/nucleoside kinase (ribokinase family) [Rhizobium sp. WW_1]